MHLQQDRARVVDQETPIMDLSWVDEWIQRVRPYLFVREEDQILIRRPNQAQKLNAQGVRILKPLLEGGSLAALLDEIGRDPRVLRDVGNFLREVKRFLEGDLREDCGSPAVEIIPFEMEFSKLPILSEVAITYRCNLKCTFCYAGCNCTVASSGASSGASPGASSGPAPGSPSHVPMDKRDDQGVDPLVHNPVGDDREMSVAEIQEVLRKIYKETQVPSVSFTGGEATLRPELPDLVAYAHDLGMRVNLITNGTMMTSRLASDLARAGLDSAQVSIEGVTAEVHERVTMIPRSFERSIAAVDNLASAGILVHSNTTINRDNLHECQEMPFFVKERLGRDKFSMNLVIPTGSAALNDRLVVRYSELGPHLERIQSESKKHGVEFMWYSPTPMCMFNPIQHGLGNKGCSACDGLISVGANGDVIPCASYDEGVGNILDKSALEVWKGQRAGQFRDKFLAHPQCRSCENFHICHGACPLYWRQMGFDELVEQNGFRPLDKKEWFEQ